MITAIGMIVIPLCLICIVSPVRLLGLVFICSAFMAAAILVVGNYGIPPGLLPTAMFVAYCVLQTIFKVRYPAERLVFRVLLPFILVVAWALAASFLMPRFFEGDILVWPEKMTIINSTPLAPNAGNETQDFYLILAAALTICASCYLTKFGLNLRGLFNAYLAAGFMVVAISIWQLAGNLAGIWFPTTFFLSNPGWSELSSETIGSFIRLTGPCSEPSELAAYLCSTVGACGWIVLNGHRGLMAKLLLAASTCVVLLCTSTTGYAALCGMSALVLVYAVLFGSATMRKQVVFAAAAVFACAAICVATVPVVAPGVAASAAKIYSSTVNKQHSSSYTDRTKADRDSVEIMLESDGLGVGWGSNRSSSLVPGLLSEVGLFGVGGLVIFVIAVILHVRAAHRLQPSEDMHYVMRGCTGGLVGSLIADAISSPTVNSPDFYLVLSLLIAAAARVRFEAKNRQSVPPMSDFIEQPQKLPVGAAMGRRGIQRAWHV
jgi:hypothetical protein